MLTALLLPLLIASGSNATPRMRPQQADPPIKVWLNDDRFERGDKAKVYVKADRDGYVVVLHAEPDGRVRVIFPLDPTDDDYIKAGETYEVRGRGDRNAFTVYDSQGEGVVFAAYSPDPFRFDSFVRSDHWDYRVDGFKVGDDAEADLTELARQMSGQSEFEYDLTRYDVEQHVAYGGSYYPDYYPYYPYYYSGWYDPWYRPWHSGIYIGVSFGRPWYYSCWYCDPWYYDPWYPNYYYHSVWYRPYNYYDRYGWGGWYSPYRHGGRPSVIYTAFGDRYGYPNARGGGYAGQQRYGFNYVQPGRRTLSMYGANPGPSEVELRRRVVIPPTDIVAPANNVPRVRERADQGAVGAPNQSPGRRETPSAGPAKPRASDQPQRAQPSRRPDTQPRGLVPMRDVREPSRTTERSRPIREASPVERQPTLRQPSQQARPESSERPRLERRTPERANPAPQARPSEPRMSAPRSSPSRPSSPPRVSAPSRSGGGSSAPRAAPRSGGGSGGGRSQPSSGRRRG
jgi:hypothetical protein